VTDRQTKRRTDVQTDSLTANAVLNYVVQPKSLAVRSCHISFDDITEEKRFAQ